MLNSHDQSGTQQLMITAYDKLGELERILRVIRHRGGRISSLTMQTKEDTLMIITIALSITKPVVTLQSQIEKLANVLTVSRIEQNLN